MDDIKAFLRGEQSDPLLAETREAAAATASVSAAEKGAAGQEKLDEELNECCSGFAMWERLLFCGVCFGLGMLVNFIATMKVPRLLLGDPKPFAAAYTLGNILSLSSTLFLVGPVKQVKNMFTSERWIASCMYIGALALTLFFVFCPGIHPDFLRVVLVLICLICQLCAYIWYIFSYIPFARTFAKTIICGLCDMCYRQNGEGL